METQTGFNLKAAVEAWRSELATQPNLTTDDRLELEAHLRDGIADLQKRGLTEAEAFWLARRRIGQPAQLAEEFVKGDPIRVWRARLFWIAAGVLAFNVWGQVVSGLWNITIQNPVSLIPDWVRFYIPLWLDNLLRSWELKRILYAILNILPLLWVGVHLARGHIMKGGSLWQFLSQSRVRFSLSAAMAVLAVQALAMASRYISFRVQVAAVNELEIFLLNAIWPLTLVAIATWLMPNGERRASYV
jgi:hypothetical protein